MGAVIGVLIVALLTPPPVADVVPEEVGPPGAITYGESGAWVNSLNVALNQLGFHADSDAGFGRKTRHAVFAFQKHYGLATDGVFRSEMWQLLDLQIALPYRPEANRIEVDLAKQVLYMVEDGEVALIVPVSSGSGELYRHWSGGFAVARTPEGRFTFDRRVKGYRHSYLGSLYNPYYFRGGYAIHGSSSVPNQPVSHGCIRVTNWDMNLLTTRIKFGWTVYVYGQRTPRPAPYRISHPAPIGV